VNFLGERLNKSWEEKNYRVIFGEKDYSLKGHEENRNETSTAKWKSWKFVIYGNDTVKECGKNRKGKIRKFPATQRVTLNLLGRLHKGEINT